MKVKLKNIGLVKDGEYEIKNLNIFCGDNNTGKTWAIYVFYGFLDFIQSHTKVRSFKPKNRNALKKAIKLPQLSKNLELSIELNQNLLDEFLSVYCNEYSSPENLSQVLAAPEQLFADTSISVEEVFSKSTISMNTEIEYGGRRVSGQHATLVIDKKPNENIIKISISKINNVNENNSVSNTKKAQPSDPKLPERLEDRIIATVMRCLMNIKDTFIASVERTGASMFIYELDENNKYEFIKTILAEDKQRKHRPFEVRALDAIFNSNIISKRYPSAVQNNCDFIKFIKATDREEELFEKFETKSNRQKWSDEQQMQFNAIIALFDEIAYGKYSIEQGTILYQSESKDAPKLPITICSSAIRALVHLNYYLRYAVNVGDILIIDEPELNLHPSNQIKISRLLAMISNFGIKVIISTHSDLIIQEFNTLIGLKYLCDAEVVEDTEDEEIDAENSTKLQRATKNMLNQNPKISQSRKHKIEDMMQYEKYRDNMLLDPKEIQCEIVKLEPTQRSVIESLTIKPITGIISDNFDRTIDRLNRIKNTMFFEV